MKTGLPDQHTLRALHNVLFPPLPHTHHVTETFLGVPSWEFSGTGDGKTGKPNRTLGVSQLQDDS